LQFIVDFAIFDHNTPRGFPWRRPFLPRAALYLGGGGTLARQLMSLDGVFAAASLQPGDQVASGVSHPAARLVENGATPTASQSLQRKDGSAGKPCGLGFVHVLIEECRSIAKQIFQGGQRLSRKRESPEKIIDHCPVPPFHRRRTGALSGLRFPVHELPFHGSAVQGFISGGRCLRPRARGALPQALDWSFLAVASDFARIATVECDTIICDDTQTAFVSRTTFSGTGFTMPSTIAASFSRAWRFSFR